MVSGRVLYERDLANRLGVGRDGLVNAVGCRCTLASPCRVLRDKGIERCEAVMFVASVGKRVVGFLKSYMASYDLKRYAASQP